LFCLWEKAWRKIKIRDVALAAAIAAAVSSPVFIWNQAHHWMSFKYQTDHVMGGARFHFDQLAKFFAIQFVAYGPFLLIAAAFGWFVARKILRPIHRLALCIAAPSFLFFAYSSIHELGLPHWTLTSWCLIVPLGLALANDPLTVRLSLKISRATRWLTIVSASIVAVLQLELLFVLVPFAPYQSPYTDLIGWTELQAETRAIIAQEPHDTVAIGVTNWSLGSRANWYLSQVAPVYVLDDRFDQFDLWENGPPRVSNILVIEWKGFPFDEKIKSRCGKYTFVDEKIYYQHGNPVNRLKLYWCRDFKPEN
jgi:hypothetical protein